MAVTDIIEDHVLHPFTIDETSVLHVRKQLDEPEKQLWNGRKVELKKFELNDAVWSVVCGLVIFSPVIYLVFVALRKNDALQKYATSIKNLTKDNQPVQKVDRKVYDIAVKLLEHELTHPSLDPKESLFKSDFTHESLMKYAWNKLDRELVLEYYDVWASNPTDVEQHPILRLLKKNHWDLVEYIIKQRELSTETWSRLVYELHRARKLDLIRDLSSGDLNSLDKKLHIADKNDRKPIHHAAHHMRFTPEGNQEPMEVLDRECAEFCKVLIDLGADARAVGREGATPLSIAFCSLKRVQAAMELITAGADPAGAIGRDGETMLHVAVQRKMPVEFIRDLITKHPTLLNARMTFEGEQISAIQIAFMAQRRDIVQLLEQHHAEWNDNDVVCTYAITRWKNYFDHPHPPMVDHELERMTQRLNPWLHNLQI